MNILETQKEELISSLEEHCLNQNFGSLNKTDFDLLMFHHYMEALRKAGLSKTNYEIAKQLGITVQRVVNLKDKEASRFPYDETVWRKQFLEAFNSAYLSGDKLVINITDRRLYRELESFLEKKGLGTEYDLNPSIFKAEPEQFVEAIKQLYPGNESIMAELEEIARVNNPIPTENEVDKYLKLKAVGKFVAGFAANVLASVIANKISII